MKKLPFEPQILKGSKRDEMLQTCNGVVGVNQLAIFVEAWGQHYNKIFHLIREDFEDILILSLTKCCRYAHKFDCEKGSLSTWVKVIVFHTLYDAWKGADKDTVLIGDLEYVVADPVADCGNSGHDNRYAWVENELEKLPNEKKDVMKMYLDEVGVGEIAKTLGYTPSKVSMMVYHVTDKLRAEYQRQVATGLDADLAA